MASPEELVDHFRRNGLRDSALEIDMGKVELAIFGPFKWRRRVGLRLIKAACIIMRMNLRVEGVE